MVFHRISESCALRLVCNLYDAFRRVADLFPKVKHCFGKEPGDVREVVVREEAAAAARVIPVSSISTPKFWL